MTLAAKRLDWIDILRGIAISLVVIGHNHWLDLTYPKLHHLIYLFHVPLFFFITGLTLRKSWDIDNLLSRSLYLISCYFLFSLILLPLSLIRYPHSSIQDILLGILYATGNTIHIVPMWFLTCLAITVFFSIMLINSLPSSKIVLFLISLFLIYFGAKLIENSFDVECLNKKIGWGGACPQSGLFWNVDLVLMASGYTLFGFALKSFFGNALQKSQIKLFIYFFISLISFTILVKNWDSSIDFNNRIFEPIHLALICSISGIFAATFASIFFSNVLFGVAKNLLVVVGKSTLIILVFHSGLQTNLIKLLNVNTLGSQLILIAFIIGVCVVADIYIIKKTPFISKLVYFKPKLSVKK